MFKKMKSPHSYIVLFILICIVALATYFVPAGEYDRVIDENGRQFVVADSYKPVEQSPVSLFDIFKAIPEGMNQIGIIIFFVLLLGGAFGIIQGTGTIDAGISAIVRKVKGKEIMVIPALMIVFSLAGAILGTAEEALPFYPAVIALAIALGFDTITGIAIVLLGAGAGFAGAFLNPFTIGIAQGIADLPLFSGIRLRLIAYVVILAVTIIYVARYALKVRKNPELSLTYELDKEKKGSTDWDSLPEFNSKHKRVLVVLVVGFTMLVIGIIKLGFYITELSAVFVIMGIVSGLVGGLGPNKICDEFVKGAQSLLYGALMVGLARAIMVVMSEGHIMDTIIYSLSSVIKGLPTYLSAVGMFIVQSLLNVIIPSGSGQAATTMPIMAPLADVVGVTRQTAVLAFQFGDGFSNVISPTAGYFIAALAIGNVPYEKWVKFMLPLFLIWSAIGAIFVAIAATIGYGPF